MSSRLSDYDFDLPRELIASRPLAQRDASRMMVVRREGKRIVRYVHLSTGNYNEITAHTYTDIGMFTANEEVADDVSHLFNYLTGYSAKSDYKRLLISPVNLRARLQAMIEREIEIDMPGADGGHGTGGVQQGPAAQGMLFFAQ